MIDQTESCGSCGWGSCPKCYPKAKSQLNLSKAVIALDFDGTVVEHRYPDVGQELPDCAKMLKAWVENGARLILWTMRSGEQLTDAIVWFRDRGIQLFGINENPTQAKWTTSPKASAHVYIDDAALGCPVVMDSEGTRACVDWGRVRKLLEHRFTLCGKDSENVD